MSSSANLPKRRFAPNLSSQHCASSSLPVYCSPGYLFLECSKLVQSKSHNSKPVNSSERKRSTHELQLSSCLASRFVVPISLSLPKRNVVQKSFLRPKAKASKIPQLVSPCSPFKTVNPKAGVAQNITKQRVLKVLNPRIENTDVQVRMRFHLGWNQLQLRLSKG